MFRREGIMMKKFKRGKLFNEIFVSLILGALSLLLVSGCSDDDDDDSEDLVGNWVERSDFEGVPRSDAVAFTIGDKAYVGTGYDGSERLNDFWEYDPARNNWTRKADFPGVARNGAVGFGTDEKGYVGTGYDGTNRLNDFYEYDPAADAWTKIEDFGGSARYGAVAFAINGKGYVGTGDDGNFLKDFWEYNPGTGAWTSLISLEGKKRRDAVAFVIDGKGYVCTGINNGSYEDDFWVYDPATGDWDKLRDIANNADDSDYDDDYTTITGINKVAFSVGGKGYVVTGGKGTTGTVAWEYNPDTDLWLERTSLEATSRIEAVGFAIGDLGYVTTGRNSSYYFDDLWAFEPGEAQVDLDKAISNMILN